MKLKLGSVAMLTLAACAAQTPAPAQTAQQTPPVSMQEMLDAAPASDWRPLDPENTIYMDVPRGRIVIELAPAYAPNHVANVKALSREGYFDDSAIIRSHDNYVVQWARTEETPRPLRAARETLPAEFDRAVAPALNFTALPDVDTYAPEVGFSNGFPVARGEGRTWLAHCYAMVGAGRAESVDSGGGTELMS
jgi:peptidylprolyl isomerase